MLLVGRAALCERDRPRDRIGSIGLWALVALLAVMHVGAIFGPPPPSEHALFTVAIAAYSLLGVAWWIDRHREDPRNRRALTPTPRRRLAT